MNVRVLNRDQIKYLAALLMLIDHIIQVLSPTRGIVYETLDALSHFTFVTMSFFLVEGFYFTRSRKKYLERILLFAVLSQLPFMLAFSGKEMLKFTDFNIFFSLAVAFVMIMALEKTPSPGMRALIVIAAALVCMICDWGAFAAIITYLFWRARGDRRKQWIAYLIDMLSFGIVHLSLLHGWEPQYGFDASGLIFGTPADVAAGTAVFGTSAGLALTLRILLHFGISLIGFLLSAVCVLLLYNGRKSTHFPRFNKWFFYVFYPGHLLILGIIRLIVLGYM